MNDFTDYSMMYARVNDWPKEKLASELARYRAKASELAKRRNDYARNVSVLEANANYFEKRINEIQHKEMRESFVLKKEHLLLLKNLNVDQGSGYLFTDSKRPLGYSYHIEGIVKALGLDVYHGDLTEEKEQELFDLARQMPIALEAIVERTLNVLSQS